MIISMAISMSICSSATACNLHSRVAELPIYKASSSKSVFRGFASFSISFPCKVSKVSKTAVRVQAAATQTAKPELFDRKLYVGNIPRTVSNEELAEIFEKFGTVEKAEVMYDKYTQRSRRFAFVTMSTVEEAQAASEKLNGSEIGGRTIKVNITEKPLDLSGLKIKTEEPFIDSPYKAYIGNLAKTVTTETLKKTFAEKGNVLSAKVVCKPETGKSLCYGFVSFSSESDVQAAISTFNNQELEGKVIRVSPA